MTGEARHLRRICVYCGSSPGSRPAYAAAARDLGHLLASRGIGLVYGGGNVGLMGIVADAVVAAGGEVIGVIPEGLLAKEVGHTGLADLRVVPSMHHRKALMAELADAFIALPGGYGTLEEFAEMITWLQLGIHRKPCGLLNVAGFHDGLLSFLDHAVGEGFVRSEHRQFIVTAEKPDLLLEILARHRLPAVRQWLDPAET